ncbi:MAG: type II toxin-antitoxin system HicB family antitoxin [Verrucomicrobia bacterium]|nr:type II toxin-antitoxin system HicB family antitoxin [Verrucomicrobiota bacterium]
MLAHYLDIAMEMAQYEILEEDGAYWGEIPGLQGVWAKHQTLAGCQRELREALSDWVALRLRLGLRIPELAQVNLNQIDAVSHA